MPKNRKAPVLFVGHGSPMNAIENNSIRRGWRDMGKRLGKPRAIVAVSAHWYANGRFVRTEPMNEQIDDMYGFPDALYEVEYEPASDTALARKTLELLGDGARGTGIWGIDHGVWSVLCNMYPDADVPVVMVSTDALASPEAQFETRRKLAALRDEGAMLFASGNVVHNLQATDWSSHDGFAWNKRFDRAVRDAIASRDFKSVVEYRQLPEWRKAVPTPDHFFPLLTALGAVAEDDSVEVWNEIFDLGSMSHTSYLFQ